MSHHKEFVDGQESVLNQLKSGSFVIPSVDVDDYVTDYAPNPDSGCRRTYKISSSGCRINLGSPFPVTYIFVQGKDSACIVTRSPLKAEQEELQACRDLKRILMCLADPPFKKFGRSSLGFPMPEKHGDLKHFAVVSVRLSPSEIRQEMEFNKVSDPMHSERVINLLKEKPSCACLHEQSAAGMLQFKLANDAPFTFDETIQTAISAIQCLYQVLFQDDEIEVYAVGEGGRINKLLEREEIGWHLAAVKTPLNFSSLALQLDLSSSRREDLHPNARFTWSWGSGGILRDGRCYDIPPDPRLTGSSDSDSDDSNDPSTVDVFLPQGHAEGYADYAPKPGDGYTRISIIESIGSKCYIRPGRGSTFIFVQGKESACIVSRDSVKDKETGYDLRSDFIGFADTKMTSAAVLHREFKEHGDIDPFAAVSVGVNYVNLNEEKGFEPDSNDKDPGSRLVSGAASLKLLKQKVKNGIINKIIQDPGSRFANEEASINLLKQKLGNATINENIQDPGSRFVNEEATINLLKQKLEHGTINETIQTAILALQCLYGENVKSHEIEVCALQDNKMDFLAREEIERHLTVINKSPCLTSAL